MKVALNFRMSVVAKRTVNANYSCVIEKTTVTLFVVGGR